MKRLPIIFLLFALPVEAAPLDFFRHPIRTMERHPVVAKVVFAGIAAGVHARGLEKCRERSVEFCDGKYGEGWAIFGVVTGMNILAIPLSEKIGGWQSDVISYGGSAAQLGHGIVEWEKGNHEKVQSASFRSLLRQ